MDGVVEETFCQRRVGRFGFFQPKPQRGRHVVAKIGERRRQKDTGALVGRSDRRLDGSRASANDDHVRFIGDRQLARRLVHRRPFLAAGRYDKARKQKQPEGNTSEDHGGNSFSNWLA